MESKTKLRPLCTQLQPLYSDPLRFALVSDENGSVFKLSLDGIGEEVQNAWAQPRDDDSWLVLTHSNTLYSTRNSQCIWRETSSSKEPKEGFIGTKVKRVRSEQQQEQTCKIQNWKEPIACCSMNDDTAIVDSQHILVASKSMIQITGTESTSNFPCCSTLKADPTRALWLGPTRPVLLGLSNGDVVEASSGTTIASLDDKVCILLQIRDNIVLAIATNGSGCLVHLDKATRTNFALQFPIVDGFLFQKQILVCLTSRGFLLSMQITPNDNGDMSLPFPQKIHVSAGRISRAFQISPNSIGLVFGENETWCAFDVSIDSPADDVPTSLANSLTALLDKLEQQEKQEFVKDKEDHYLAERIAIASLAIQLKHEKMKCFVRIVRLGCDLRLRISVNTIEEYKVPINLIVHLQQGTVQEIISESIMGGKQDIELVPSASFFSNCYNRLLPLRVKVTSYVMFENGSGISRVVATSQFDAFDLGELDFPSRPISQQPHKAYPIIRAKRSALLDKLAFAENHVAGSILRAVLPSHWAVSDHSNFKASSASPEIRVLLDVDGDSVDLQLMANDIMVAAVARSALLSRFSELLKNEVLFPRFSLSAKRSVAHLHAMCESLDEVTDPVSKATLQHSIAMNTSKIWQAIRTSSYHNNVQM